MKEISKKEVSMKEISLKKLFVKNLKSRLWLFLLILIAGFFIYPVSVLMIAQQAKAEGASFVSMADIGAAFLCRQTGNRIFLFVIIAVAAFVAAVAEFNYMHRTEAVDFWNAAAVKRKDSTLISWCAGALLVIVPYIITYLTGFAIAAGHGALMQASAGAYLLRCLYDILLFLTAYTFAALGQVVAGRTFIGVCMGACFGLVVPAALGLYAALGEYFFPHLRDTGITASIVAQTSPVIFSLVTMTPGRAVKLLAYLAGGLVLLFLAAEKRPAESVGNAFAFRFLYPLVKSTVTIFGAIGFAILGPSLFFSFTIGQSGIQRGWYFFFLILAGIVIPVILDLVFYMDWRGVKKGLKLDFICLPVLILVSVIFAADPFRVDTYVPADADVKAVGISYNGMTPTSLQGDLNDYPDDTDVSYQTSDAEAIKVAGEIARDALKNPRDLATTDVVGEEPGKNTRLQQAAEEKGQVYFPEAIAVDDGSTIQADLCWTMKSGRKVRRTYVVDDETYTAFVAAATEDPAYRKVSYLPGQVKISDETEVEVHNSPYFLTKDVGGKITGDDRQKLISCLQEDAEAMTLTDYQNSTCIGTVDYSNEPVAEGRVVFGTLNIYPEYEHTLAFLKEKGMTFDATLDPSHVTNVTYHYMNDYSEDSLLTLDPALYGDFFRRIRFVADTASTDIVPGAYGADITFDDGNATSITFTLKD